MYDVIIIGKGPSGISASLYTSRGKLETLVIGGISKLAKSNKIDNYYGFPNGITGEELLRLGEEQAKQFGVNIVDDIIFSIEYNNNIFSVLTKDNKYESKSLLIATGQALNKVQIENIEKFEGKGIHYCVTCDGFFYNGKKVGILGYTDYGVHEAIELLNYSNDVTMYSNGKEMELSETSRDIINDRGIKINSKKIVRFEGEDTLNSIIYEDESKEQVGGIFIAYGSASSADFARKIGILMNRNSIIVDKDQKTIVPGLFAAGDCTESLKQISVAVGQGAVAGQKIVEYIRELGR